MQGSTGSESLIPGLQSFNFLCLRPFFAFAHHKGNRLTIAQGAPPLARTLNGVGANENSIAIFHDDEAEALIGNRAAYGTPILSKG